MEPTRDGVLDFLADRAMGILVLLFVVSYALIRPAYERFYEPMGLRPEDLGLNQIEMISSGAAILAGLILIPVVQIMLGVTLYLMLQRRWLILQILVPTAVFILAGYGLYRSLTILSMFFYHTFVSTLVHSSCFSYSAELAKPGIIESACFQLHPLRVPDY
jgi:hypothetical protein